MNSRLKTRLLHIDIAAGLLLVLVGVVTAYTMPLDPARYGFTLLIVRDYLFMNLTHVLFTFVLIASFVSVRESLGNWSQHVAKNKKWALTIAPILIFILMILSNGHYQADNSVSEYLKFLIFPIAFIVPYFHTIRQHYGLILYYFPGRLPLLRRGHIILLCLYVVYRAFVSKGQFLYGSWNFELSDGTTKTLEAVLFISMFAIALLISIESIFKTQERKSSQFLYSLRFFIYPLAPLSLVGGYLIGMVHGLEYALFLIPLMQKQNKFKLSWWSGAKILCLTSAAAVLLTLHSSYYPQDGWAPFTFQLLAAIHFTFLYLHYLIDSLLFRVRRPENASFISLMKSEMAEVFNTT